MLKQQTFDRPNQCQMIRKRGGGLYLLMFWQQFAELCELLCSVTVADTLPDILNYLLSRPVEKTQSHCKYDIIGNMLWGLPDQSRCQFSV